MTARRQYGDQRACALCGSDIEWHGKAVGWIDRGSNTHCDTSGMHPYDRDTGAWGTYPHRKHRPESERSR